MGRGVLVSSVASLPSLAHCRRRWKAANGQDRFAATAAYTGFALRLVSDGAAWCVSTPGLTSTTGDAVSSSIPWMDSSDGFLGWTARQDENSFQAPSATSYCDWAANSPSSIPYGVRSTSCALPSHIPTSARDTPKRTFFFFFQTFWLLHDHGRPPVCQPHMPLHPHIAASVRPGWTAGPACLATVVSAHSPASFARLFVRI